MMPRIGNSETSHSCEKRPSGVGSQVWVFQIQQQESRPVADELFRVRRDRAGEYSPVYQANSI